MAWKREISVKMSETTFLLKNDKALACLKDEHKRPVDLSTRWFKTALVSFLAVALVSCTSVVTVDLEGDRQANLKKDLQMLDPLQSVDLSEALSLNDVIRIGLENNLDLRVSRFEQEVAKDSSFADKLELLPDLDISANGDKVDKFRREGSFNPDTGVITAPSTTSRLKSNKTRSLELTWSVLDFGLSYIRSRQSQLQQEVLQMRRNRQAQTLALDLTEAFWKAALAEDALDYVRRVERELKAQRAAIEQSVSELQLDAIAAKDVEKRLVDLALSVRDLQADIANARIRLARLMGLKQNTRFVLKREAIKPLLAKFPRPDQLESDVFEEYALNNRPELFERDLGEHIQRDEARAAMLSMFPSLSFSTGRNFDGNTLLESNYWNSIGYSVGWNLLALPSQYYRAQAEEKKIGVEHAARLQLTVAVITQVHIGLLDYKIAVERFKLYEQSYGLTSELLGMTRERNAAGILSDLSVAQRLLEDMAAKLRRDQAVVDLIVTYRRLLTSSGLNPDHWNTALVELGIEQEQIGPKSTGDEVDELLESYGLEIQSSIEQQDREAATNAAYQASVSPRSTQLTSLTSTGVTSDKSFRSNAWSVKVKMSGTLADYLVVMQQTRTMAVNALSEGEDGAKVKEELRRVQNALFEGYLPGLSRQKAAAICDALSAKGLACDVLPPV